MPPTPAEHEVCVRHHPAPIPDGPELLGLVYEELRRTARGLMRRRAWRERLLDPTGLVNEAVVRLLADPRVRGHADRRYVFAAALRAMRRILVERARARSRAKRGGGWARIPLDQILDRFEEQNVDVLELHDAIEQLAAWDERQAEVVTMRFFLGMKVAEIADHFGLSDSTIESDLALARAWLRRHLSGAGDGATPRPGGS